MWKLRAFPQERYNSRFTGRNKMDAERLNQLSSLIAQLQQRSADLRRYL